MSKPRELKIGDVVRMDGYGIATIAKVSGITDTHYTFNVIKIEAETPHVDTILSEDSLSEALEMFDDDEDIMVDEEWFGVLRSRLRTTFKLKKNWPIIDALEDYTKLWDFQSIDAWMEE